MTVDTKLERETGGRSSEGPRGREPGLLMSARDIREELGVKENAAWRIIRAIGRVVKIGRSVYVHRGDVEDYLRRNTEVIAGG